MVLKEERETVVSLWRSCSFWLLWHGHVTLAEVNLNVAEEKRDRNSAFIRVTEAALVLLSGAGDSPVNHSLCKEMPVDPERGDESGGAQHGPEFENIDSKKVAKNEN